MEKDDDFDSFESWSSDDIKSLLTIDPDAVVGIKNLLFFLIDNEGVIKDSRMDLMLHINSVVQFGQDNFYFKNAEKVVSLASEYCLVDSRKDKQVLEAIGLADNSVLFLAIHGEEDAALDAAMCLSGRRGSLMQDETVRPSLSLFGYWENTAIDLIKSVLTKDSLSAKILELREIAEKEELFFTSDLEYVDCLRSLCEVGLFSTRIDIFGDAYIEIKEEAAGLFLVLCGQVELARKLANITI